MKTFANQVAVITGASSGIGWALAKALAADGCHVGLIARRQEQLAALAKEIEQAGGAPPSLRRTSPSASRHSTPFTRFAAHSAPVDLLVANAGVGAPHTPLEPVNIHDVEKMFRVNVLGMMYAIEAVLPACWSGDGVISRLCRGMASYKGLPGESAIPTSKAAVNIYMEGLRIRLRDPGYCGDDDLSGFVKTPMTEVNDFKMPFLWKPTTPPGVSSRICSGERKYLISLADVLAMKLTAWLPDWMVARAMNKYNEHPPLPKTPL